MDRRGGCCLVRYAGDTDVASKVERIMLRYRPIAPKPASPAGSLPCASQATESAPGELKEGGARLRRRRRREGPVGRRGRKRMPAYAEEEVPMKRVVAPLAGDLVTLQLMPEAPLAAAAASSPPPNLALSSSPVWGGLKVEGQPGGPVAPPGSWLTLECVAEACDVVVGEGRCTWAQARAALEGDACPAFLSDAADRVAWTNVAYRRMVGAGEANEVAVALSTGGRVPSGAACWSFSCRVRVRVRCALRCGQKAWSLVVPCDVLRLAEAGWLAWRLDVKAALSLGR